MDLRQLRYFLTVAEERRFNLAARRLHIAAPSLSQQIRALERDLAVTLFDRTVNGADLTPAGQVLAERARIILAEVDRARNDVCTADPDQEHVTLRVCTMADPVLDGPLRRLKVPGVKVFVTSSPGDDALEAVRQARADTAVVWSAPQDHQDLDCIVLGSVEFGIVVPDAHSFAGHATIPVARLGREQVVMFPRPPFAGVWQRTVDHLLPGGTANGQVVVEPDLINSPEAMVRSVARGHGIAPGILGVADRMNVAGVVVRPLDPPLHLELELVWRRPARPSVQRLVDGLVAAVQDPHALIVPANRTSRAAHPAPSRAADPPKRP